MQPVALSEQKDQRKPCASTSYNDGNGQSHPTLCSLQTTLRVALWNAWKEGANFPLFQRLKWLALKAEWTLDTQGYLTDNKHGPTKSPSTAILNLWNQRNHGDVRCSHKEKEHTHPQTKVPVPGFQKSSCGKSSRQWSGAFLNHALRSVSLTGEPSAQLNLQHVTLRCPCFIRKFRRLRAKISVQLQILPIKKTNGNSLW